jgi:hypothetical protein
MNTETKLESRSFGARASPACNKRVSANRFESRLQTAPKLPSLPEERDGSRFRLTGCFSLQKTRASNGGSGGVRYGHAQKRDDPGAVSMFESKNTFLAHVGAGRAENAGVYASVAVVICGYRQVRGVAKGNAPLFI